MTTDEARAALLRLGPLDRLECDSCHRWPQFRNWPNHILAYPSHRAVITVPSAVNVAESAQELAALREALGRIATWPVVPGGGAGVENMRRTARAALAATPAEGERTCHCDCYGCQAASHDR